LNRQAARRIKNNTTFVMNIEFLGLLAVQLSSCFSWRLGGSNIDFLLAAGRPVMKEDV